MKLKLGDQVFCEELHRYGVVIVPGPYGDQPFQVMSEGECYSFIREDGSCPHNSQKWKRITDVEVRKPHRVPLGDLFNRMTSLASAQYGTGPLNGAYKDGFEDCFAITQERYQRAVEALRMIAEHDMYGAANMRHLAAETLRELGRVEMPYVKKEIFEFLASELEAKMKDAQWKLYDNRREIAKFAKEQRYLKEKLAECSRKMHEFRKASGDLK